MLDNEYPIMIKSIYTTVKTDLILVFNTVWTNDIPSNYTTHHGVQQQPFSTILDELWMRSYSTAVINDSSVCIINAFLIDSSH